MPSQRKIHNYWLEERPADAADWFGQLDPIEPSCYGCHYWRVERDPDADTDRDTTWGRLQRAHLVDRCEGGLDGPQNLVLLCERCHRAMPSFEPGTEDSALAWVRSRPDWFAGLWAEALAAEKRGDPSPGESM